MNDDLLEPLERLAWVERRARAAVQEAEAALARVRWWQAPVRVLRLRLAIRKLRRSGVI